MNISIDDITAVLSQLNPWWQNEPIKDLPCWRRAIFRELYLWIFEPPTHRAVLLSGARQVGKTTLLRQAIDLLLKKGTDPANIIYISFDHPILKIAGVELVIKAWREREPKKSEGREYLFLDEAQFVRDIGTWIKHQTDFVKNRQIIFTGSATPLIKSDQESGVGRWHTIKLTTLSFYEYLQINNLLQFDKLNYVSLPKLPSLKSLRELFEWPKSEFYKVTELATPYVGHFHEYLIKGGFPQAAKIDSVTQAQQLIREDIIDKVLKRDMTALFGVRRVLDLEQTFLYLCMHDGGLLDMQNLCQNLEVKRPTAQNFIELLEATHLVYRLQPHGYGKDILRGKFKIYLADAAIAPAILLKGKKILENFAELGISTETAVFKHIYTHYYKEAIRFTYWRGTKDHEVDLVAETHNALIPFEIKYRTQNTGLRELKGLLELCKNKSIQRAYLITKSLNDFGLLDTKNQSNTQIMRIPAPLLCYWLGEIELSQSDAFN